MQMQMSNQKYEPEVVVGKTGSHRAAQYERPPTMSSASSSLSIFISKPGCHNINANLLANFWLKPFFGFTVAHFSNKGLVII